MTSSLSSSSPSPLDAEAAAAAVVASPEETSFGGDEHIEAVAVGSDWTIGGFGTGGDDHAVGATDERIGEAHNNEDPNAGDGSAVVVVADDPGDAGAERTADDNNKSTANNSIVGGAGNRHRKLGSFWRGAGGATSSKSNSSSHKNPLHRLNSNSTHSSSGKKGHSKQQQLQHPSSSTSISAAALTTTPSPNNMSYLNHPGKSADAPVVSGTAVDLQPPTLTISNLDDAKSPWRLPISQQRTSNGDDAAITAIMKHIHTLPDLVIPVSDSGSTMKVSIADTITLSAPAAPLDHASATETPTVLSNHSASVTTTGVAAATAAAVAPIDMTTTTVTSAPATEIQFLDADSAVAAVNFAMEHRIFLKAALHLLRERDARAPVVGMMDPIVYKSGPLKKASHLMNGVWKVKYVEIRRGMFSYYEDAVTKDSMINKEKDMNNPSMTNSSTVTTVTSNATPMTTTTHTTNPVTPSHYHHHHHASNTMTSNNTTTTHNNPSNNTNMTNLMGGGIMSSSSSMMMANAGGAAAFLLRKNIPLDASSGSRCRPVKLHQKALNLSPGGAIFELNVQGTKRLWMANTREERQAWIQAIHNAMVGGSVTRGNNTADDDSSWAAAIMADDVSAKDLRIESVDNDPTNQPDHLVRQQQQHEAPLDGGAAAGNSQSHQYHHPPSAGRSLVRGLALPSRWTSRDDDDLKTFAKFESAFRSARSMHDYVSTLAELYSLQRTTTTSTTTPRKTTKSSSSSSRSNSYLQIPVKWLVQRQQQQQQQQQVDGLGAGGGVGAAGTPNAAAVGVAASHDPSCAFREETIEVSMEQLRRDLQRDAVLINGMLIQGDTSHGPDRIVAGLTERLLSVGRSQFGGDDGGRGNSQGRSTATTHLFEDLSSSAVASSLPAPPQPQQHEQQEQQAGTRHHRDPHALSRFAISTNVNDLSESQALAYARDILLAGNRTRSAGDSYYCINALCSNNELVVVVPSGQHVDPVSIDISQEDSALSINSGFNNKSGWIKTRGRLQRGWKKWFFVLAEGTLSFYEGAMPRPHGLRGQLALKDATVSVAKRFVGSEKQKKEGFVLSLSFKDGTAKDRQMLFHAEDRLLDWVYAFECVPKMTARKVHHRLKSASRGDANSNKNSSIFALLHQAEQATKEHALALGMDVAAIETRLWMYARRAASAVRITVRARTEYKICTTDPEGDESLDTWGTLRAQFVQAFRVTGGPNSRIFRGEEVVRISLLDCIAVPRQSTDDAAAVDGVMGMDAPTSPGGGRRSRMRAIFRHASNASEGLDDSKGLTTTPAVE